MSTPPPYHSGIWHKARLDLIGFLRNEGRSLPRCMQDVGNGLYGTHENEERPRWKSTRAQANSFFAKKRPVLARHHTPPWSTKAPEYVQDIYRFLAQAGAMLEQEPELKQAA